MNFLERVSGLALAAALIFAGSLRAAEVTGTVKEVSGAIAAVEPSGGTPAVGDTAEIFFKLAGVEEEISVATGTVTAQEGKTVKVKIESATGDVAKDQSVRFIAGKGAPVGPVATPAIQLPPPTSTPAAPGGAGYIGAQVTANTAGGSGALVVTVTPNAPAARGGIVPDDVIMAVDGSPVEDQNNLITRVSELTPGSGHAFLVSRAGKLQKIELTIDARPPDSVAAAPTEETTASSSATTLPPTIPFPSPAGGATKSAPPNESSAESIAAPFVNKGIAQYSAGNIDGAIASYTAGIRVAPSVGILYLNRGSAYLYKPNFNAAIADANKALELKVPKADDAYNIRGSGKAGLGDYDGAIADCNRALKVNPSSWLAYNNRSNNKIRKGDYKGALADCNKSISLDSSSALPYYNRGFVYYNLGNAAGALSDWKKAVAKQASFGAELNPKIAQLEAAGVQSSSNTKSRNPPAPAASGWVDLTNAPQKIVGTWQGGRHRTRYFADGTFVVDPHLVPNPPRGQWQVQGDRLIEYFPQANQTVTSQILGLDRNTLTIQNVQGNTFRLTRLK